MAEVIDVPLQRTLRIGKVSVGLIGLDVALNRVLADSSIQDEAAAAQVYEAVAKQNYVPESAVTLYQNAIADEVKRLRQGKAHQNSELVIRILGPGCVSCNNMQTLVIEIMAEMGVAADIFQIHDLDEIGRYGVLQTPALIINDHLKSAGRLPSRSQIEQWLREEIG